MIRTDRHSAAPRPLQAPEQAAFAALPCPAMVVDEAGMIAAANAAAADCCGLDADTMAGRAVDSLFALQTRGTGDAEPVSPLAGTPAGEDLGSDAYLVPRTGARAGTRLPVHATSRPLEGGHRLLLFTPGDQLVNLRQQLDQQARRDPLTGLPNRQTLEAALGRLHERSVSEGHAYSLVLVDVDRFKLINDNYGHAVGDEVLIALPNLLMEHLDAGDLLGRWSGHEFLCALPGRDIAAGQAVAETLRQSVYDSTNLTDCQIPSLTVSAGVAAFSGPEAMEAVITAADTALYEAKRGGRNRVRSVDPRKKGVFLTGGEVQAALHEGRLVPAFQPIVDLADGHVVADEALARIRRADGQPIPAGAFIDAASQLQLAHRVDHAIIRRTIDHCGLRPEGRRRAHFVNISTDLLRHPRRVRELLDHARSLCRQCGLEPDEPKPLVIEITERELLSDTDEAQRILEPFLDFGLRLAIDDFGSGYSSFRYLADLPVDFLKIEGELIRRIRDEAAVRAIVQGIQDIADSLGLTTIAEFVEDEATVEILREIGVDWAQGFHFGRPEILDEPG